MAAYVGTYEGRGTNPFLSKRGPVRYPSAPKSERLDELSLDARVGRGATASLAAIQSAAARRPMATFRMSARRRAASGCSGRLAKLATASVFRQRSPRDGVGDN